MSLTLKPIKACNMGCKGCYEERLFQVGASKSYDIDVMLASVDQGPPGSVTLHGGEFTLMPLDDMRRLMHELRQRGRHLQLQTNGSIVTKAHIDLFEEFNVAVGVSLNGNGPLNLDRCNEAMTDLIHRNIIKMRERGISVSLICVLSKTNAAGSKVVQLADWAREMGEKHQIWSIRFNPLYDGGDVELTAVEAAAAYSYLLDKTFESPLRQWLPFREMVDNLWGLGLQPCWVGSCDPYATQAVYAVFGDGSVGNCLRTSSNDGKAYLRDTHQDNVRQAILKAIPFEQSGCSDCKWWRVCHGGCPAEAIDNDWRNKSRFCLMYVSTYEKIEAKIKGLLPNFLPYPEWTTNNEADLERSVADRTPRIDAMKCASQWSSRPSTWASSARYPK